MFLLCINRCMDNNKEKDSEQYNRGNWWGLAEEEEEEEDGTDDE